MKKVAIIIPCFNEEVAIESLIQEIRLLKPNCDYELIPVGINDCSTDNTVEKLKESNCIYLDLPINLGIGGAVQTGYRYAYHNNFDIAIQLDGDGQHPPDEISKLVEPLILNQADVVIGSRFIKKEGFQSSYLRRSGINYFKWLNKLFIGTTITDSTSGFRAINKKALKVVYDYYPDEYPEPEAIILFALSGLRMQEVSVVMRERQGGVSSIRSFKSIYYMVKVSLAIFFVYLRLKFNGKRDTI